MSNLLPDPPARAPAEQAIRLLAGALLLLACAAGAADEYDRAWGPAAGSALPLLEAPDQNGVERTYGDLAGERGLLLFINRSADW